MHSYAVPLDSDQRCADAIEFESHLRERFIGQEEATATAVRMVQTYMAGMSNPDQPAGIMLALGRLVPGKTRVRPPAFPHKPHARTREGLASDAAHTPQRTFLALNFPRRAYPLSAASSQRTSAFASSSVLWLLDFIVVTSIPAIIPGASRFALHLLCFRIRGWCLGLVVEGRKMKIYLCRGFVGRIVLFLVRRRPFSGAA